MKKPAIITLFSLLLFASCASKQHEPATTIISLCGTWEFKTNDEMEWMPATVPGCVHTDLMQNKLIPDPYFGSNEDRVQWVSEKIWEYRKQFHADSSLFDFRQIELVFEGIDTHAEIFLNDIPLQANTPSGKVDNMFRRWQFDITKLLKHGTNEVLLRFYPATEFNRNAAAKLPYVLPDERVFSRKAPYQFGWDWGPKLITCGLWKPVSLQAWNDLKIENIHMLQHSLSEETAKVECVIEIFCDKKLTVDLNITVDNGFNLREKKISLKKGENIIQKTFEINDPELWYPNGLGNQKLYTVTAIVSSSRYSHSMNDTFGLRSIELVREQDSIGESFYFKVNGKAVFMKGANYIPQDNFLPRVTRDRYEKLLTIAKDSHMNMIRIWGGGVYENDHFYRLCDSLGILVWQDFIFACALYPGDISFFSTIRHEAAEQVKRLRNHPCIALWCGNNEVKNGWEDWGWQNEYTQEECQEIWNDNKIIFEDLLQEIVKKFDPARPYHASSPEWGWGHPECITEGDSHYWGVWWGEEPFEVWENKTGRFMSEYGFQSLPDYFSIEKFTRPEDRFLNSPVMKTHQKHERGYQLIDLYMKRDFPAPTNLFDYAYVSQLVQAYGVGQALEIHRRRKPHCMGTLYWQLNDCWPVTSWSSIDSDYRPKALQYTARNCFKPVLLTTTTNDEEVLLHLVSDLQCEISGKASIIWMDVLGNILEEWQIDLSVPENASLAFYNFSKEKIKNRAKNSLLVIRFDDGGGNTAEKIHYFVRPKELELPAYKLTIDTKEQDDTYAITLTGNALIKNAYLYTREDPNASFSDNYFDLLPNERKTVVYQSPSKIPLDSLKRSLKVLSLKDIE